MSFLEMLDVLNEQLMEKGEEPIAFDHDCREGICGSCGFMINGVAHGPLPGVTVCQLHMRSFKDGDELYLEPWRARAFPVVKDLAVNRSRVRPHHRGRRLHLRANRQRAGRQRDSRAEKQMPIAPWTPQPVSAAGLCGRLSECRRRVVHRSEDLASQSASSGSAREGPPRVVAWWRR